MKRTISLFLSICMLLTAAPVPLYATKELPPVTAETPADIVGELPSVPVTEEEPLPTEEPSVPVETEPADATEEPTVSEEAPTDTEEESVPTGETLPPASDPVVADPVVADPLGASVVATGTCGDDATWTLDDTGTLRISGTGTVKSPNGVDWSLVQTLIIEEGITAIGAEAFYNQTGLTSVSIAGSVKTIGNYAFYNCTSLTVLILPSGLENIYHYSFADCHNLQSVYIPASVTYIEEQAFRYCWAVTAFIVDSASEDYCAVNGALMDANQTRLLAYPCGSSSTAFTVPEGVSQIPRYAFYDADNLEEISLPASLTAIEYEAFYDCDNLSSVIYAGTEALWNMVSVAGDNDSLLNAAFTFGEASIVSGKCGDDASFTFDFVTGALVISGEGEVYDNPWQSFSENITTVTFGADITDIDWYLFDGDYPLLQSFTAEGSRNFFYTQDGVLFKYNGGSPRLLRYPPAKVDTAYTVPNKVRQIRDYAFRNCSNLQELTIPASVTSINSYAFYQCDSLVSISVAAGNPNYSSDNGVLLNKGKLLFYPGGRPETAYAIPSGTAGIYLNTFGLCPALTELRIPLSVGNLPADVFLWLPNLQSIIYEGTEDSWNDLLRGDWLPNYTDATVTFENSTVMTGACGDDATYTLDLTTGVLTVSGTGEVEDSEFSYHSEHIQTLIIEEGITGIGNHAFSSLENLTALSIPDTVTEIGDSAFYNCDSLSSLVLPSKLERIYAWAFQSCSALQFVYIPASVTYIESAAFYNCLVLTAITVDSANENYCAVGGALLDANQTRLLAYPCGSSSTAFTVPEGVTRISRYAFYNADNLEEVSLPASLTAIEYEAFYDCDNLSSVIYAGTEALWNMVSVDGNNDPLLNAAFTFGEASILSGKCGADAVYTFDTATGALVISGEGEVDNDPWQSFSESVTSVTFGADITDIDWYLFSGDYPLLQSFTTEGSRDSFYVQDGALFAYDGDYPTLLRYPPAKADTAYTVPNTIRQILDYAFRNCSNLQELAIPASVTSINSYAFYQCDSLVSISVAAGNPNYSSDNGVLLNKGKLRFYPGCKTETAYAIPSGTTGLHYNMFGECAALTELKIPLTVGSLGLDIFERMPNLQSIIYEGTEDSWNDLLGGDRLSDYTDATVTFANSTVITGACGDDATYTLDLTTGVLTVSGTGEVERTGLGNHRNAVKTLVIEEGITDIGSIAFSSLRNLTSLSIPDTVTEIGDSAFHNCDSLSSLVLPSKLERIYANAFQSCSGLQLVHIPASVTYIDSTAFLNCSALTAITVDSANEDYCAVGGALMDADQTELLAYPCGSSSTAFTVPEGVTRISRYAFYNADNLEEVSLPISLTAIEYEAFCDCDNLSSVIYAGTEALWNMVSVARENDPLLEAAFTFGEASILSGTCGDDAVYTLDTATGALVISGEGEVDDNPWQSFSECVTTVTIGAGIKQMNWNLFDGDYPLLKSFSVEEGNTQFYTIDDVLFDFNASATVLLRYPPAKEGTSYTVPDSTRDLNDTAFDGCTLTDLALPVTFNGWGPYFTSCESLQRFTVYGDAPKEGYYLFAEDGILYQRSDDWVELVSCPRNRFAAPTAFTVPDNVTIISNSAFYDCANLTEVTIPESVSYISDRTFYCCTDLETVTLPAGITRISYDAFYMDGESSLTDVYYAGSKTMWKNILIDSGNETLTSANIHYGDVTVYSGTLDGGAVHWTLDPATGVLNVSGSGRMTASSNLWSGMTCIKQVVVEEGITAVDLYLLRDSSVEELHLPASAKSISGTGSNLPNLKTVTVAAGNRNYCTVDNVLFNKDKTFLYRFPSASDRTAYAIPDTVTEIGSSAFYRCANLTEITIPDSVTYIDYGAFRYCEGLTAITLPASVPKLGDSYIFSNCTALETVTIEGLIPSIPDYTFYGCTALKHISLPGSVSSIDGRAFYNCSSLETVTFAGEEWMWEEVSISSNNGPLLAADVTCTGLGTVSGTCGDNLTWTLVGATGELTISGTGQMYDYDSSDIASPTDLTIYGSDLAWHRFAKAVRTVKVNEGVTSIGSCAFYDCTALTEISLPSGITEIRTHAFDNCASLTEISLPNSLTRIRNYAFQNCSSLTAVSLPAALNYIGVEAFSGCTALTDIAVDEANESYCDVDGVLMNEDQTILYCYPAGRENTAYIVPDGISEISNYAFYSAIHLESISLPISLTWVGHHAFSDCSALSAVDYAGTKSLWGIVDIGKVNEPLLDAHFTFGDISTASGSCGNGTFWTFDAVTGGLTLSGSGEVHDSLWWAFNESITSVTFGSGIADIDWYLFNGDYPLLQTFVAEGSNRYFYVQDGVLFAKNGGRPALLRYPAAKSDLTYAVPEGVTNIYYNAFRNCSALTEVTVPASVTSIDNYAFSNSYSLAAIRVAEDNPVFSSDNGALLEGDALLYYPGGKPDTSYAIPEGTTRLDSEQFGECTALTELHIPFSVGYLYVPLFNNLPNLERIVYEGSTASWDTLVGNWDFAYYTDAEVVCTNTAVLSGTCGSNLTWTLDSATGTLTVSGEGGLYGYDQWNTPWSDYRSLIFRIVVEEGVNSIGQFAFAHCRNATEVRIPASVTFIGPSAFYECDSLTGFTVAEASADYMVQDGVLFSADGKTLVAFPGGYGSDRYTVPESVTQIAPYAFRNCDIEEILIPDTVTSIGEGAFYYCRYLTDLQLPASVTAISYAAFARCESLTQVDIPETVTAIDTMAFQDCGSLSAVEIPSGVTAIGDLAFSSCYELTDITLPETLVSIGEAAFYYSGLRTAKLPAGIETIPSQAFEGCSSMTSVTIPLSVKDIDSYAFDECSALSSVVYAGDTTDWLDIYISYGNEPLKRAYLASNSLSGSCGDGVTWSLSDSGVLKISGTGAMDDYLMYEDTIPWGDFRELVTSIVVEEGVTAIGQLAFYECYNNTSVSLPASLTSIGLRAFNFCAVPGGFTLAGGNTTYQVRDGVLLTADGKTLVAYPLGGTANAYTVPATVTTISPYAFADCDNLQEVRLPDGLTNIGESAFWDCDGLTSMAIPAGVTAINDETFYSCSSLHTVTLPEQVKSIGNQAFSFTGLRSVNIPDTVTSIGYYAFAYTDLQQVEIPAATATIGNRAFYGCYDLTGIFVAESNPNYYDDEGVLIRRGTAAASAVQAVKVISSWNDLKLYVPEEPADVSTDVLLVYPSARTAREYTVPDSVGIIDSGAFLNCPALEKLTLGANITESYTMLNSCDGLTAIKVDEDNPVFYSIDGVLYYRIKATQSKLLCYPRAKTDTAFTLPGNVTYAYFDYPEHLAELTVPLSVQHIEAYLNSHATIRYEGSEILWNSIANGWWNADEVICSGRETALSGTVGDSIRWTFDAESDTLILSGSGDTGDFQPYYAGPEAPGNYPPWYHLNYRYVIVEEGVTRLGDFALDHDRWISSISLPATLTAMGEYVASLYWPEYEETEIPAGVTDLCGNTFGPCKNITLSPDNTAFVLEDGVLFTADRKMLVAYYRTDRGTYAVPEGVETIGAYAFYDAYLEGILLPDSVTTVEEYAFYGCQDLRTLTLPGKVETVGIGALLRSGLTELTVENPFMRPDPYWFVTAVDQTDLQAVTFGGTEAQWPAASAHLSQYYPNVDVLCTGTDGLQIDFDADGNTLYLSGIDPDASCLMVAFYDGSGRMALAKTYSAAQVSAGVTVTHSKLDFSSHTVKVFLLNGSYAPVADPIPVHTPAEN